MVVNALIANSLIEWNASFNTTPLKSSRPLLFYPMRHWLTVFVSTNASLVSPTIAENMAKCTQCMMGGLMHHILKKTLTQRVLEGLGPRVVARVVWWLTTNLCIFTVVSTDNPLTIEHCVVMIRVSFPPNAINALYHRWYIFYFIFYSLFFIFFYIWKTVSELILTQYWMYSCFLLWIYSYPLLVEFFDQWNVTQRPCYCHKERASSEHSHYMTDHFIYLIVWMFCLQERWHF